jgi:hypothetical protein
MIAEGVAARQEILPLVQRVRSVEPGAVLFLPTQPQVNK